MDPVRKLILEKLQERDIEMSDASRQIGRNHAYLQQFLKRGVPAELKEKERIRLANLLEVPEARLRGTPPPLVHNNPARSQSRDGNANLAERVNHKVDNPTLNPIPATDLMGEVDLPVLRIEQGGQGTLVLEKKPFTRVSRPRRLADRKDGYGVLVRDNSLRDEYKKNDIAYIDPNINPEKDDPCLFRGERADGSVEVLLRYLDRPDDHETLYYVRQTNPPKKYTIKKADWQKCHVAVGKESGR